MERFAPRFMCDKCSLRMEVRRRLSVSARYMGAIVFETLKLRNSRILFFFGSNACGFAAQRALVYRSLVAQSVLQVRCIRIWSWGSLMETQG